MKSDLTRLAVIIVHYRAGELLARAVRSIQDDLESSDLAARLVVVDNGSDAAERKRIRELPVRYIAALDNPGYAAALNLGVHATDEERLLFMNPDVLVLPGCTARLLQALERASAAGPRFYWGEDKRFLLPPTERRTRRDELLRQAATWGEKLATLARRKWRMHARSHWLADQILPSYTLSGALMAVRRDALELVGLFDEGFRLYFEEDDWLHRLKSRGLESVYVPQAEAVHLFNQSAAREPQARVWFEQSQTRFAERHYGKAFIAVSSYLPRSPKVRGPVPHRLERPVIPLPEETKESLWVEVSPASIGVPAAGELLRPGGGTKWELPQAIWTGLEPGRFFVRLSNGRGDDLGLYSFYRPPGASGEADGTGAEAAPASMRMRDGEWTIRTYAEGDETAILGLFEIAFHKVRPPESWEWKYGRNPYGNHEISLAFDSSGELAAHYGSYPCRFYDTTEAEPRTVTANQIGDTMTSRKARKGGFGRSSVLARVMRHHFARFCEGRVGFNFGFNTDKIQRYYLHLVPGSFFLEAAPFRVLDKVIEVETERSIRVERVQAVDDRWDSLFKLVAPAYRLLVERDQRYLRWRYLECPDVDYRLYALFDDEALVGWGVFREQEGSIFWGDALFDRRYPAAPRHLLAEVRNRYGSGNMRVEAWFPPRPGWWDHLLLQMGFESRPEPQNLGLIYKPFLEEDLSRRLEQNLYYTKGDGDLF